MAAEQCWGSYRAKGLRERAPLGLPENEVRVYNFLLLLLLLAQDQVGLVCCSGGGSDMAVNTKTNTVILLLAAWLHAETTDY